MTLVGTGIAVAFWFVDSVIDVVIFDHPGPIALWPDNGRELMMRFTVVGLTILVGWIAEFAARSQRSAEASLRTAAGVFEAASDALAIVDRDGRLLDGNRSFHDQLRYANGLPEHFDQILDPQGSGITVPWERIVELRTWRGEINARRADGQIFPAAVSVSQLDDTGSSFAMSLRDLSADRAIEARLRELAQLDHLTGLANRTEIRARMERALARAQRSGQRVVVLFVDLDHFKDLNDSLGHSVGDAFLSEVACRLLSAVRQSDAVGRLGGDEFVIVLEGIDSSTDVLQTADKIREELAEPVDLAGRRLSCRCSIGASVYPEDGGDVETLLRAADTAMYHAKNTGRDRMAFFREEMNQRAQRRLQLSNGLRDSLDSLGLELAYQPIYHLDEEQTPWGVEALLRWSHPQIGPIPASELIEIAEDSGLIVRLGERVIHQAFADFASWRDAGLRLPHLAVNISPTQLREERTVGMLVGALETYGIEAGSVELEVTESLYTEINAKLLSRLERLHYHGFELALDDFGTGYSSLAALRSLPVQRIKIDRSFVSALDERAGNARMINAIVALARSLDLMTTAEGIENEPELRFLRQLGCQLGQGFLLARPMTAQAILEHFSAPQNLL